jgi:hypothetical protein
LQGLLAEYEIKGMYFCLAFIDASKVLCENVNSRRCP